MHFNSVPAPVCESFTSIAPPGKENEWEVDCSHCGLNPMCRLLAYGDERAELPEGLLLRRERVARGETIFRKGDPFRSIFAVKSGSFMSVVNGSKDAEQVVGFHFAGELMGAEGLAEGYYPYTARALESCSVCELRMERLQETGCSVEKIQQGIIMLLGSQVAHNHALSASLIRQNGEQRLAAFILGVVNRLCALNSD